METGSSSPYDSHPALKERIGALSSLPGARPPEAPEEPAVSLLGHGPDLERELFRFLNAAAASMLVKLGWRATAGFMRFVTLSCGELSWEPLPQIEALLLGVLPGEDWRALCTKLGIADVGLSDVGSPGPEAPPKGAT